MLTPRVKPNLPNAVNTHGSVNSSICAMQSSTRTPHEVITEDPYLEAMHANAEVFDHQTERLFRYLQVCYSLLCMWPVHS